MQHLFCPQAKPQNLLLRLALSFQSTNHSVSLTLNDIFDVCVIKHVHSLFVVNTPENILNIRLLCYKNTKYKHNSKNRTL